MESVLGGDKCKYLHKARSPSLKIDKPDKPNKPGKKINAVCTARFGRKAHAREDISAVSSKVSQAITHLKQLLQPHLKSPKSLDHPHLLRQSERAVEVAPRAERRGRPLAAFMQQLPHKGQSQEKRKGITGRLISERDSQFGATNPIVGSGLFPMNLVQLSSQNSKCWSK